MNKCNHIFDECGRCFECNVKSKAQLMKETRQRRKDAGLVEFRAWVTPEKREELLKLTKGNNQ